MKRTVLNVIVCLCFLSGAAQSFVVEAQAPIPNEQFISQGHDETIDHPPFELPERWTGDDKYLPSDRENPEERVFVPPSEESLRLTWQQVQSFDCAAVTDVPQMECEALVALYESANGAGWEDKTNWLRTTTVGNWNGITVSDGHVSEIELYVNNLNGTIPFQLGSMTYLQILDLSWNQLSGTIPASLGNLTNLQYLDLDGNQLTGTIPAELGNLASLDWLDLGNNQLSGTIPSSLGNLTNLTRLDLGNNQLTGTIPAELGDLSFLYGLCLGGNQLSGTIPSSLGNLTSLQSLSLSWNQLTGTIPSELGNLDHLTHLDLSHNFLEGDVPSSFSNLVNLCVQGDMDAPCYGIKETDLGYNLLNVPQPNPPADFLYEKDPDWDQTQGVKGVFQGAEGGTLISNDGRTTLVIPAGAVEGEVTIILKPTTKASGFMSPFVSARNDFEVLAFDANGAAVTEFDQPLTFTLHYEDGDIGMIPEDSLAVHYFDVGQQRWLDAVTTCADGGYSRNPEANMLSLPVCHLTEFAFVGEGFYSHLPLILR